MPHEHEQTTGADHDHHDDPTWFITGASSDFGRPSTSSVRSNVDLGNDRGPNAIRVKRCGGEALADLVVSDFRPRAIGALFANFLRPGF